MATLQLVTNDDLTTPERTQLKTCEACIEKGIATFIDVGNALLEIRDSRLYRETHGTFEAYCRDRWQMSKAYSHRMIAAAEVVSTLSPIGDILPTTESQARPLTKLEPEQQLTAWEAAVATADTLKEAVTAAIVSAAVEVIKKQPDLITPETNAIIQSDDPDLVQAVIAEVTAKRPRRSATPRIINQQEPEPESELQQSEYRGYETPEGELALAVWGCMKDFERCGYLAAGAKTIFNSWADCQKPAAVRLVGPISDFFNELKVIIHEEITP